MPACACERCSISRAARHQFLLACAAAPDGSPPRSRTAACARATSARAPAISSLRGPSFTSDALLLRLPQHRRRAVELGARLIVLLRRNIFVLVQRLRRGPNPASRTPAAPSRPSRPPRPAGCPAGGCRSAAHPAWPAPRSARPAAPRCRFRASPSDTRSTSPAGRSSIARSITGALSRARLLLQLRRIQPRDHVALLHPVAFLHVQLRHAARRS